MAAVTKVVRVANPRRRAGSRVRRNNSAARRRRKLSAKQIRHFGTPAQKAALKRKNRAKRAGNPKRGSTRRKRSSSRPKVKVIYRSRPRKKRRRRSTNPALVVTLGSVGNPRKRRTKQVAAKRKRRRKARRATNTRRRRHHNVRRRRRNARRITVVNTRRRRRRSTNSHRRRRVMHRRHNRRRRNPALFGRSSPKDLLKMIGGGLIGVTVTKLIPGYIKSSGLTSSLPQGGFMNVIISGVSAWLAGFLIGKFDLELGQAAMFGGFMQTGSVALNTFLPSVGGQFSLGDLVDARFVVPQNPLYGGGGMSAMGRGAAAYPSAY